MQQQHRVALVTGASRGLGAVVSRVLAERGYDLVLSARDGRTLDHIADPLRAHGGRVVTVAGDVADQRVRAWLLDEARMLGGLHVLLNNASELGGIRPFFDTPVARLERVLQVNVIAPVALTQLARPLLADSRGLIVNISSDAAQGAYAGWGAYGASKAALELLTRTLARERTDPGISAVIVDPGDMRTRMHQEAFPGQDISDRPLPDVTVPFWNWLFDQEPRTVNGERFAAQQENARWLLPA